MHPTKVGVVEICGLVVAAKVISRVSCEGRSLLVAEELTFELSARKSCIL